MSVSTMPTEIGQPAWRPVVWAVHMACLSAVAGGVWVAPSVHAQGSASPAAASESTLPTITVTADPGGASGVITQQRAATVGKSSVAVQDTPFSMSIVEAEQAREQGAKNVQDALLYSAGVYAGRYGFDTRGDWAAIRGLSPSVYQDGLRSIYGFYNSTRPEFFTLERVEVLKGPSSALYGQADLGGIVNVVSKRPKKTTAREINLQIGSHARKQVAADLTGPLNQDSTLLYRLVALTRDSDTQVDHVNDDALVVMPSLTWQPNADTSLTLQYLHQKNESKVSSQFLPQKGTLDPAPLGTIPISRFVGEPEWDRYDTGKDEFSVFWDQRLSNTWKLAANLRKTRSDSVTREIYAAVGPIPDDAGNMPRTIHTADRETDVLATDVRLESKAQWGSTHHTFAVGIDHQNAQWDEFNYSNSATGGGSINLYNPVYGYVNSAALTFSDRPDNRIVQTGVYVMDHMEWGPWVISGALRHDRARNEVLNIGAPDTVVKNTATTGRIGLMYRMSNGFSPYVSASTAFSPNLGTDGTASGRYLEPTTGEQTEAGVKYLSASGNTSAAFAMFDIEQENRVANASTPGGLEQVAARTKGWEMAWRQRMGALELLANYTRLDAVNPQTAQRLSSVPESTASAWAQYQFNTGWRAGLGARHIGDVTGGSGRPVVPSVNLFDAMVGYTTGPWDFRLNLQNLADKAYVSWCRGQNLDCGYGEGRNVLLTASYKF